MAHNPIIMLKIANLPHDREAKLLVKPARAAEKGCNMLLSQVEGIISSAIQQKRIVEVKYKKEVNGAVASFELEPFDVSPMKYEKAGGLRLWGWCLDTKRVEQYAIDKIVGIVTTRDNFDPKVREQTFMTPPKYRIPRDW
jgi:predicted DNA-binding transcriptional regulator YafY